MTLGNLSVTRSSLRNGLWSIDETYYYQDHGVVGRRFAGYGSIDLAARLTPVVESVNAPTAIDYQIRVDNLQTSVQVSGSQYDAQAANDAVKSASSNVPRNGSL